MACGVGPVLLVPQWRGWESLRKAATKQTEMDLQLMKGYGTDVELRDHDRAKFNII